MDSAIWMIKEQGKSASGFTASMVTQKLVNGRVTTTHGIQKNALNTTLQYFEKYMLTEHGLGSRIRKAMQDVDDDDPIPVDEEQLLQAIANYSKINKLLKDKAITYIPSNWPRFGVFTRLHQIAEKCLKEFDLNDPSVFWQIWTPQKKIELERLRDHLNTLRSMTPKEHDTETAKTLIAVRLGWQMVGGSRTLELYLCNPQTLSQIDVFFIRQRLRSWYKYLEIDATIATPAVLERVTKYIRETLQYKVTGRVD